MQAWTPAPATAYPDCRLPRRPPAPTAPTTACPDCPDGRLPRLPRQPRRPPAPTVACPDGRLPRRPPAPTDGRVDDVYKLAGKRFHCAQDMIRNRFNRKRTMEFAWPMRFRFHFRFHFRRPSVDLPPMNALMEGNFVPHLFLPSSHPPPASSSSSSSSSSFYFLQ